MTIKPQRFTRTCEIRKKNKVDMEIECLAGATGGGGEGGGGGGGTGVPWKQLVLNFKNTIRDISPG